MRQHIRTLFPFLERSLQVRFHVVHLVLAEPELVPNHLSNSHVLLPSIDDVREVFLLGIFDAPPNDVFPHQTIGHPVNSLHVLLDVILTVMLLPHELLEIFQFTLSLPVLSSFWTSIILVVEHLCPIMSPSPVIESGPQSMRRDLGQYRLHLISLLEISHAMVLPCEECILYTLHICLSKHAYNVCGANEFIITCRLLPRVCKGANGLERISHNFCSHHPF